MHLFQRLSFSKIHMDAAWQARIEAPYRTHDVYTLEFIRPVLFKNRRILNRVFVRTGRAVEIARIGVPRGGRVRMIIGYLASPNHHVVREHTPDRLVKTATDRFLRHLERGERFRTPSMEFGHGSFREKHRGSPSVGWEIGPGAVSLNGVAPLGYFPFKLDFRLHSGLWQHDLDAVAGCLDVTDIDQAGQRGGPEPSNRTTARVECQVIAG